MDADEQKEIRQIASDFIDRIDALLGASVRLSGPADAFGSGRWWLLESGAKVKASVWWNVHRRPERVLCGEVVWTVERSFELGKREGRLTMMNMPDHSVDRLVEQIHLWYLDEPIYGYPVTSLTDADRAREAAAKRRLREDAP